MRTRPSHAHSASPIPHDLFALLVGVAVCGAVVIQFATVFDLYLPGATRLALFVMSALIAGFTALALMRGRLLTGGAALALMAYLLFEHWIFTQGAKAPANYNAVLGYFTTVTFVVFAENRLRMVTTLRILLAMSVGYLAFYVLLQAPLLALAKSTGIGLLEGDYRGQRLYIAGLLASFVAFYALVQRDWPAVSRIALFALSALALWLSGNRTLGFIFLLIVASAMLGGRRQLAWTMIALVTIYMVVVLAGLLNTEFNPFQVFASDDSGRARAIEYDYVRRILPQHWLFGVGIDSSFAELKWMMRVSRYGFVYWTDLGGFGLLGQFGIVGLLGFVIAVVGSILAGARRSESPEIDALRLNCMLNGFLSLLAPGVLLGPACVFTMLLFAMWLRRREAMSAQACA